MSGPAEMADRKAKTVERHLGNEMVEAESTTEENDAVTSLKRGGHMRGANDLDFRLPTSRSPGPQIVEAILVTIGPALDGKPVCIARKWRSGVAHPDARDLSRVRSGCTATSSCPEQSRERPPSSLR